jgi:hypothetical protein
VRTHRNFSVEILTIWIAKDFSSHVVPTNPTFPQLPVPAPDFRSSPHRHTFMQIETESLHHPPAWQASLNTPRPKLCQTPKEGVWPRTHIPKTDRNWKRVPCDSGDTWVIPVSCTCDTGLMYERYPSQLHVIPFHTHVIPVRTHVIHRLYLGSCFENWE